MSPRMLAILLVAAPTIIIVGGLLVLFLMGYTLQDHPEKWRPYKQMPAVVKELLTKGGDDAIKDRRFRPAIHLLEADLVYPLLIALSLTITSGILAYQLGVRVPWWVLVLIVVSLLSDWSENGIMLRALIRLRDGQPVETGLPGILKLLGVLKCSFLLVYCWLIPMAVKLAVDARHVARASSP